MTQIATFELQMTVLDKPTTRKRWNGEPMQSEEASAALFPAVEAFRAEVERHGFVVAHTGYGVKAGEA
jgi:hypothetical protein